MRRGAGCFVTGGVTIRFNIVIHISVTAKRAGVGGVAALCASGLSNNRFVIVLNFTSVSTTVSTLGIAGVREFVKSFSCFITVHVVTVGIALICPIVFLVGNPFPLSGNANVFGYGCFRVPFRSVFVREPTQEIEFILLGSFEVGSNTAVVDLESFGNTINRISYGFRTEKYQGANSNCHQCEQNQPYNEAGIVLFRGVHVRHFLFLLKIT